MAYSTPFSLFFVWYLPLRAEEFACFQTGSFHTKNSIYRTQKLSITNNHVGDLGRGGPPTRSTNIKHHRVTRKCVRPGREVCSNTSIGEWNGIGRMFVVMDSGSAIFVARNGRVACCLSCGDLFIHIRKQSLLLQEFEREVGRQISHPQESQWKGVDVCLRWNASMCSIPRAASHCRIIYHGCRHLHD